MEPGKLYFFTKEAEEEYHEACKDFEIRQSRSFLFNIPFDVPLDSEEEKKLIEEYKNKSYVERMIPLCREYNNQAFKLEAVIAKSQKNISWAEAVQFHKKNPIPLPKGILAQMASVQYDGLTTKGIREIIEDMMVNTEPTVKIVDIERLPIIKMD